MVKFLSYLQSGSERSRNIKNNAVGAVAIKIIAMVIQIIQIPIVLSYLDSTLYGIYLTITSLVLWTHNFDFGLGNGLRYKLTESLSKNDYNKGKSLVSTAYISLFAIMALVALCLIPIISIMNWQDLLNCNILTNSYLITCVIIVLVTILIQFVLELITIVLQATQKAAISTIFRPTANIIALMGVVVLREYGTQSLLSACIMLTLPIVIVLLIANIILYSKKLRYLSPSIRNYDKHHLKDIYSLGIKLFITSLAGAVVFNLTNFLLSHYINPNEVAVYQTAYTYFGTTVIFFGVLLTPFWAGITDAYVKGEIDWLKKCMRKLSHLTLLFSLLVIFLLAISKFAFMIWIGNSLNITISLSVALSIYFIGNLWSSTYNCFIVGVGKAQVSMYVALFKIIAFIPVAIFSIQHLGTIGIVVATICINTLPNIVFGFVQYKLIVNNKAIGVWNK